MLREYVARAENDEPLWLPDLRAQFLRDPAATPLILRLTLQYPLRKRLIADKADKPGEEK